MSSDESRKLAYNNNDAGLVEMGLDLNIQNQQNISDKYSSTIDEDDIPIEITHLSSCSLCKSLAGAAAGNFLEWFDFAIYGLLADEIGANFFPKSHGSSVQLLEAFAVYAGAFFMRPIGGAIFGYIGDKYGRITALRISIFMMAIPTFLTGCLPTYHSIGITATILLVLLRLIQGLSVGGEITGALVYVLEICPQNRRSLFGVLVQVSGSGTLLAIIVEAIMRHTMSEKDIYEWGWRIPFLCGIVVALFGIWIRRALPQSHDFVHSKNEGKLKKNPISHVLCENKLIILMLVCHLCFSGSSYYTIYVWLPTYLSKIRPEPLENAYSISIGVMIIGICFGILSGHLGDKYSTFKVIFSGGCLYLVVLVVVFPFFEFGSEIVCAFCMLTVAIAFALYSGPTSTWAIDQLHDASIRYSTLGVGYNISLALFGGTAPLLATAMATKFGLTAFAWVLFSYGVIALTTDALVTYYNNRKDTLHTQMAYL